MCPLCMGMDVGGWQGRLAAVNPGKLVTQPIVRAVPRHASVGENNAAWANRTRSAGDAVPMLALAISTKLSGGISGNRALASWVFGGFRLNWRQRRFPHGPVLMPDVATGSGLELGGPIGMSICHKPVEARRYPRRTILLLYLILQLVTVKETAQAASHSCPMERREWDARAGTMWTLHAAEGRPGTGRLASCVECMIDPFGFRMLTGLVAGRLLLTGALIWKKLLVVPVSAMIEGNGSGGPTTEVDYGVSI